MRTVGIILFDGVQSLDVTGPLEVFAGANSWRGAEPAYQISTASLGAYPVRTSSGLRLAPDQALTGDAVPDILIVPGGDGARRADPELVAWLRAHARRAARLVSVCTGAFLLAEAGLLDGRRVTTHWAYCDALAAGFPAVRVEPDPIFVRDGTLITSAGVTAGIDLALALVEDDLGRDAALAIARHLVVFLRRPGNQAQFSAQLADPAGRPGTAARGAAVDRRPPVRRPVGGGAGRAGQPVPAPVRAGFRRRGRHAAWPLRRPGPA